MVLVSTFFKINCCLWLQRFHVNHTIIFIWHHENILIIITFHLKITLMLHVIILYTGDVSIILKFNKQVDD